MAAKTDYFSADALRKDLKGKTVRGGIYTAAAQGAVALVQAASVLVMVRLLQPSDFGLVAMVTVFTGFAAMFVDAGMSMATIQRPEITQHQVSNLFYFATALGLLTATVVVALSPVIAWFYHEPRLVPITLALSSSFVLSGLTVQHQALLRRAMRFKALAAAQVFSVAFGYVVAIAVAWHYRSYWALVLLPISTAAVRLLITWWACGWQPSLPRRGAGVRGMIVFGANLTGFTFVNYFSRNTDKMLIGWWSGASPLGFYERAYKLMMAPLIQINGPLTSIMVPALSRLQDRPEQYRRAYFRAMSVLQIVSCPLMAFVAVTAPWIVGVAFGKGWEEVAPILRWLAIAALFQPLAISLGWLYISQGRGQDMMRWGLWGSSLIVLSFALGLPWGPIGVACAYAIAVDLVVIPLAYLYAGRKGPVTALDLARLTLSAAIYTLPTVVASLLIVIRFPDLPSLAGLALSGLASAVASSAALLITSRGRALAWETFALLRHALVVPGESI